MRNVGLAWALGCFGVEGEGVFYGVAWLLGTLLSDLRGYLGVI